jgi:hypothetical protein
MSEEILNFVVWYSGMKKEQIENAYEKYKIEQKENEKSTCCNAKLWFTSGQKFCSICNECLGSRE